MELLAPLRNLQKSGVVAVEDLYPELHGWGNATHLNGGLPLEGLLLRMQLVNGVWVDSIGILTSRSQVDESIADIFFDGETKRADSAIVALAYASYMLNIREMVGREDDFLALYAVGTPRATLNKAVRYARASWSAAYDPKAVFSNFMDKIDSAHVDFVGIGDSNQLKDGFGWDYGFQYAISRRYPMYSTGLVTAADGNGSGSGIGYKFSRGTATFGAYSGAPESHSVFLDTATSGFAPHDYSYIPDGSNETILSQKGMIALADCPIDITGNLKYRLYYGTFDFGSGSLRPAIRMSVSPYTNLAYTTKSTNSGANGIAYADVSLAANAARTYNIDGLVTQAGYGAVGPVFSTYQTMINTDRSHGFSYSTMIGVGGWSTYDMALSLQSVADETISHFFAAIREKQYQSAKNVAVLINSGLNDKNETELSIINGYTGDSAAAYQDNLEYIISRLSSVYPGTASELKFILVPSHPISTPDDSELVSYRTACRNICNALSNVAMLDISSVITSTEMLSAGYYYSGGTDKNHLVQAGYEGIAELLFSRR